MCKCIRENQKPYRVLEQIQFPYNVVVKIRHLHSLQDCFISLKFKLKIVGTFLL